MAVVLTGGIASGKSTVANLFSALGIPIIDADQISRELVQPGSVLLDKIIHHFGRNYLCDNSLDRSKLRERIFNFPEDRQWLENLLHPEIYSVIQEKILGSRLRGNDGAPYIICVIPLYVETQKPDDMKFDKIFVVDTEEKFQISRLIERDKMTVEQAKNILKSQSPREARLKSADEIIVNNGDIDSLKAQIVKIDKKYSCRVG